MLPTAYKIGNWEWKWLPPDMQKIIKSYEKENKSLKDDLLHYIQREEEYRKEIEKLKIEIWWLMWERDGLKMVVEKLHKEIEEQEAEWKWLFDEIDYRKREAKRLWWKSKK